jgi:predicted Zn-ribbon and HTH transcriptional regulator
MITSTLLQWDEDACDWPRRRVHLEPPRCDRCGADLTDDPVSALSRHCRACVDAIVSEAKDRS